MGQAQRGLGILCITVLWAACSSSDATFSPVPPNAAGHGGKAAQSAGGDGSSPVAGSQSGHGAAGAGGTKVDAAGSGGEADAGDSGGEASGGAGQGGKGGAAGGGGKGGTAGGGGKGGTADADSGGAGGDGGSAGNAGGSAGAAACLQRWKGSVCDSCSAEVQADRAQCSKLLECYRRHDCSPQTCSGDGDICSEAAIGAGAAPFPIAAAVYECLCQ